MRLPDPLKLKAHDAEDLAVVAAVAQDALVPVREMAYQPADRRFVLVLNRFGWDRANKDDLLADRDASDRLASGRDAPFWDTADQAPYERTLAGLTFEMVDAVQTRGIDLRHRDRILELLTVRAEPGAVLLVFSGDATIRLDVAEISCYLEDFGASWPTRVLPRHTED